MAGTRITGPCTKATSGLTKILAGDNETGESEFDASIAALESRDNEDAAFFAKQLVDVRAFFEKRKAADVEARRR